MGEFESVAPDNDREKEAREEAFVEDVQRSGENYHLNSEEMRRLLEKAWLTSSSNPDTSETREQLH